MTNSSTHESVAARHDIAPSSPGFRRRLSPPPRRGTSESARQHAAAARRLMCHAVVLWRRLQNSRSVSEKNTIATCDHMKRTMTQKMEAKNAMNPRSDFQQFKEKMSHSQKQLYLLAGTLVAVHSKRIPLGHDWRRSEACNQRRSTDISPWL